MKFKIATIFGTRPEIIRLSSIIKKLQIFFNHKLINTGQNFDIKLNKIFFRDNIEDNYTFDMINFFIQGHADFLYKKFRKIQTQNKVVICLFGPFLGFLSFCFTKEIQSKNISPRESDFGRKN